MTESNAHQPPAHLTPAQMTQLRTELEKKRTQLQQHALGHLASANASRDELSEEMDVANHESDVGGMLGLVNRDNKLIEEIEEALGRFADGTYGVSEESGEPIPFERLELVPWARYTAAEEEVLEKERRR